MLKDNFDQYINKANIERLKEAIKFLLDPHASPVFGAAKTIEHEIAAFNALQTLGYIQENADEYDLVESQWGSDLHI
jgi:hypothetical protein